MKKKIIETFLWVSVFGTMITGCGNNTEPEENKVEESILTETEQENENKEKEESVSIETSADIETSAEKELQTDTFTEEQTEITEQETKDIDTQAKMKISEKPTQEVTNFTVLPDINSGLILYVPNKDNTKIICEPWNNGQLSTREVLQELEERGIIPDGVSVNQSINKNPMILVLNDTFKNYLDTLTPEQEDIVIASVMFSIGGNWGHGELQLEYPSGENLITNNYEYDIPITADNYYELFE